MQSISPILPPDSALDNGSSVAVELVAGLLATAITDIEVVARELSLSAPMLERMRRALDCLQCVSEILETEANGRSDVARPDINFSLDALLREWPDDYLARLLAK